MVCQSCGNKIKKAVGKVYKTVVSTLNGIGITKELYQIRMNSCRACGFFNPQNWYCAVGNADARALCKGGRCKMDKWK